MRVLGPCYDGKWFISPTKSVIKARQWRLFLKIRPKLSNNRMIRSKYLLYYTWIIKFVSERWHIFSGNRSLIWIRLICQALNSQSQSMWKTFRQKFIFWEYLITYLLLLICCSDSMPVRRYHSKKIQIKQKKNYIYSKDTKKWKTHFWVIHSWWYQQLNRIICCVN